MTNFVLTIKGDTNDADYITASNVINDDDTLELPIFVDSAGVKYTTMQRYTELEFIQALAKVLKMTRKTRHNWTRFEYDHNDDAVRETIGMLAKEIYNIDITSLDKDEDSDEQEFYKLAFESIREYVQEYLPVGEYGIHTISSISYCPANQRVVLL